MRQTAAFTATLPFGRAPQRTAKASRRRTTQASLPTDYDEVRIRATQCVRLAHADGVALHEVQFPAVSNQGTAALNQLLDANRTHARIMLTRLRTLLGDGVSCAAIFPDSGEAQLASRAWRDEAPCAVNALNVASSDDGDSDLPLLAFCVNPGFNVSEWFALRSLADKVEAVVVLNGDLDRIRSGYYPRLFYPRLYDLRTQWLVRFDPVFYLKPLADGGTLLREYPGDWELYYRPLSRGVAPLEDRVLWTGTERPTFQQVQGLLRKARIEDQLAQRK